MTETSNSINSFSPGRALHLLFDNAAPYLDDAQLKFLADNIFEHVELQSRNLAELCQTLGILHSQDMLGPSPQTGTMEASADCILFHLAESLNLFADLLNLDGRVQGRLNHPEWYGKINSVKREGD